MSIIHDALKKVQQELTPKAGNAVENPLPRPPKSTGYIYETSQQIQDLPPSDEVSTNQKPPAKTEIKAVLALACAILIIVTSGLYIWQQFQLDVPKVQLFARKSMHTLMNKIKPADAKSGAPVQLQSLAELTITPPASKNTTAAKPTPITLDVHGIMSRGTSNLVLINDQVYQEGDEVDGAKIIKINLDSITILNNGEEETIPVKD